MICHEKICLIINYREYDHMVTIWYIHILSQIINCEIEIEKKIITIFIVVMGMKNRFNLNSIS